MQCPSCLYELYQCLMFSVSVVYTSCSCACRIRQARELGKWQLLIVLKTPWQLLVPTHQILTTSISFTSLYMCMCTYNSDPRYKISTGQSNPIKPRKMHVWSDYRTEILSKHVPPKSVIRYGEHVLGSYGQPNPKSCIWEHITSLCKRSPKFFTGETSRSRFSLFKSNDSKKHVGWIFLFLPLVLFFLFLFPLGWLDQLSPPQSISN